MSDKNELYEHLKKLLNENKIKFPDNIIMNPQWRDAMENKRFFGIDPAAEDSDDKPSLFGMNVTYSPFVETGKVYFVDTPKFEPLPMNFDYKRYEQAFATRISASFGVPSYYFAQQPERPYKWQKLSVENLLEWGERLASKGLLDNPKIRWEYQKAILGYPFQKLKAVWLRFND